jgi:hypothetical protein
MSPELEEKLVKEFPNLFKGRSKSLQESLMSFGCEHDDGWFNIIRSLCREIDAHLKHIKEPFDYEFTQIKEKFGTLRVYDNGHDDHVYGIISMAEAMSAVTCEITGRPGRLCRSGMWYKTLCDEYAEKHGYVPATSNDEI